jgi:BMFP domain-containing protein YqiC
LSTKSEQMLWRREKVLSLKVQGLNHSEIARELQIPRTCIVEDANYLRNKAKESIKEYVTERFPEQYQICLSALDIILRHAFEILQTSHDNREKLQAMEVFKDTHMTKLELLSNASTIDSALNYVKTKQREQQQEEVAIQQ